MATIVLIIFFTFYLLFNFILSKYSEERVKIMIYSSINILLFDLLKIYNKTVDKINDENIDLIILFLSFLMYIPIIKSVIPMIKHHIKKDKKNIKSSIIFLLFIMIFGGLTLFWYNMLLILFKFIIK